MASYGYTNRRMKSAVVETPVIMLQQVEARDPAKLPASLKQLIVYHRCRISL
jgi:hypothetical protein